MRQEHEELWKRIRGFPLDEPGAEFSFSDRLGRENGWDSDHARRVVEEYRRFMFLAVAAGHPVTPSDAVDQAWHQHLTYSRSYWERFCDGTLGKRIHHEPTRGGLQESLKFAAAYERTLESYRRCFGTAPPPEIWPPGRERFGSGTHQERVDVGRHVVVSKVALVVGGVLLTAAAAALGLGFFLQRLVAAADHALNLRGPEFLGFYALLFATVLAGGLVFRRMLRTPNDEPEAKELDLDAYEVAFLAGGEERAFHAALAALVNRGEVAGLLGSRRIVRTGPPEVVGGRLEKSLARAIQPSPGSDVASLKEAAGPALEEIRSGLRARGLVVPASREFFVRGVCTAMVLAAVAFGLAKAWVGLGLNRPILFLVLMTFAFAAAGFALLGRRLGRTRRGDRALQRLRHEHRALGAKSRLSSLSVPEVPLAAGLFGLGALDGLSIEALRLALQWPLARSAAADAAGGAGAGGCGGDGGGGCGGGGCGGCGGCA